MPEWDVGRRGGVHAFSYDVGNRAREREQAAKETPEQAATKRVELLWHDADSAVQRAGKLSVISVRKEWREERGALEAKHRGLKKELEARAVTLVASRS